MSRKDMIMDKIDMYEDQLYDLEQAGEYDAAKAIRQTLADLYHSLELAN